ncbi:hypothetical protein B0J13DRAFT_501720 [Dactylonectria estremocensis]|uniref:Phosphotransferase n=1 Tax=Dactylonectria estremocensis TaxID=1079267 RepID=A0A9P9EWB5_9HYPO|nr:hypothetical protein B0J13DRAFT_501720 [Dactylonectria estremocensis]
MASPTSAIQGFLEPLHIDLEAIHLLSKAFQRTFETLALESQNHGGTNLRVGFVELRPQEPSAAAQVNAQSNNQDHRPETPTRMRRRMEKSWPIDDHLKNENSDSLFLWIGKCIAEVILDGCNELHLPAHQEIPLGVTFSFPMVQHSLSEATLMTMGKGFAISSNLNLGARLLDGYNRAKSPKLPPIRVEAIANDSVSTLVSFVFTYDESTTKRGTMGLILGTGCNATIPLRLSQLHPSKRPQQVPGGVGEDIDDVRITVNTEWSINGTAPPLRELGLMSRWDEVLDSQNESPGFQPLEYMTAGRYLGELGRIMLVDYMTNNVGMATETLPARLLQRHGLTTTFLSHFKPLGSSNLLALLRTEFPESSELATFVWTEDLAIALYHIAKAIEVRAAGIVAAATLALLTLAGDVPPEGSPVVDRACKLGVGYTGGCIVHFQDYLSDCQQFLDQLLERRLGHDSLLEVELSPCHDGGVTGAGILVAAAASSTQKDVK